MDTKSVLHALNNDLRREILKILFRNGNSTVKEVYSSLKNNKPKYRQSVNKALDQLNEVGLVEKCYSTERKKIIYSIKFKEISICFEDMKIQTT